MENYGKHKNGKDPMLFIFLLGAAVIAGILAYMLSIDFDNQFSLAGITSLDPLCSIGLLLLLYLFRKPLNLKAHAYGFTALFLILHNFGLAAYIYNNMVFFLRYDKIVHTTAGMAVFYIFFGKLRALLADRDGKIAGKGRIFAVFFLSVMGVMAVSAFTEIIEFTSGDLYNKPGPGFFFYGAGDLGEWRDSITDMIANFTGSLIACLSLLARFSVGTSHDRNSITRHKKG